jgi:glycosyltransferase involved in cell wall biosynthesis
MNDDKADKPQITVIMPVYNVEGYLESALQSVCDQSYTDWELVIVDDGSTDGSPEICRRYAAADARIHLITTENRGVAAARNVGIDAARGSLLAFVDSDDVVSRRYLEVMHTALTEDVQIATVGFTTYITHLSGTPLSSMQVIGSKEALITSLYQLDNRGGVNASLWGKLYRRELFHDLRCTPGILYEDLDMVYKLLLRAQHVAVVADKLYYYRIRQGSIIHTFSEHRLSVIAVCERLCEYPEVKASPLLLRAAQDRLFSASYNMLLLMHRHHHCDRVMKDKCREYIHRYRRQTLFNPHARLKNRFGAIADYLGVTKLL